jgi:N utilization substance protein B
VGWFCWAFLATTCWLGPFAWLEVVEHWRPERIGVIERNILRIALHELLMETAPPRVIIDEAVRLAQRFAGVKAPAFVNGVLDRLARRAGRL